MILMMMMMWCYFTDVERISILWYCTFICCYWAMFLLSRSVDHFAFISLHISFSPILPNRRSARLLAVDRTFRVLVWH